MNIHTRKTSGLDLSAPRPWRSLEELASGPAVFQAQEAQARLAPSSEETSNPAA